MQQITLIKKDTLYRWVQVAVFFLVSSVNFLFSDTEKNKQESVRLVASSPRLKNKKRVVKVLLDEKNICSWDLSSHSGFIIRDTMCKRAWRYVTKTIKITHKKDHYYANGVKIPFSAFIISADKGEMLLFNDKPYSGTFEIVKGKKNYLLINRIELEQYLEGVVRSESWPGWPLEVNKAFAIASRSYVVAMMQRARKAKQPYHVKDSNVHQRYNLYGVHGTSCIKNAVESTQGLILMHQGNPIIAMFDSCCGGIIPAHIEGFDFEKAPYLARQYPCTFCTKCSAYKWEISYNAALIQDLLKNNGLKIAGINDFKVIRRDKAGLVREIMVKDKHKKHSLEGKLLYGLLDEVKSFCFDIETNAQKIIVSGFGLGHHLGLCQWGAREMVRQGYSFRSILDFYYPATKLVRLS